MTEQWASYKNHGAYWWFTSLSIWNARVDPTCGTSHIHTVSLRPQAGLKRVNSEVLWLKQTSQHRGLEEKMDLHEVHCVRRHVAAGCAVCGWDGTWGQKVHSRKTLATSWNYHIIICFHCSTNENQKETLSPLEQSSCVSADWLHHSVHTAAQVSPFHQRMM